MSAVGAFDHHRPLDEAEALLDVLGPFVASPDALTSWTMNAAPGRVCTFARVPRLSRGGVGERSRQLAGAGLLALLPQRLSGVAANLFDYRVRRTDVPFSAARLRGDEDRLTPDGRLLYDLLIDLADDRRPCPNNASLAALLGFRSGDRVRTVMGSLRQAGFVRVRVTPVAPGRQIEIVESGVMTGLAS